MFAFRPALFFFAMLAAPGLRAAEDFATLVRKGDAFDAALKTKEALALYPNNDLTYHVLGAWHYELANLNSFLRAIAKLIYGAIPEASNEEAVKNFQKAIELNPKRLANHVELGRSYAALGQKDLAKA